MITPRSGRILNYIVKQYIAGAIPIPSQSIADKADLGVSPATIRNEMAQLEKEGYLIRPHTSAGCIPSDKGYRSYVASMENIALPREMPLLFREARASVDDFLKAVPKPVAKIFCVRSEDFLCN